MSKYQNQIRIARLKKKKVDLNEQRIQNRINNSHDNPLLDNLPDDILYLIVMELSASDRLRLFCVDFRLRYKINHDIKLLRSFTFHREYDHYRTMINNVLGAEGIWDPKSILMSRDYGIPGIPGPINIPGVDDSKPKYRSNRNDLKIQSKREKRLCRNNHRF